jgi:hypothetical protein
LDPANSVWVSIVSFAGFISPWLIMCTISENAKRWLTAALDPFHDDNLELAGMPDTVAGNSFVLMVKQTVNVQAPTGATTPWSFTVSTLPVNFESYRAAAYANNGSSALTDGVYTWNMALDATNTGPINSGNLIGPITYASYVGGASFPLANYGLVGNTTQPFASFGNAPAVSPGRIIGTAFEVRDVTPVLYKQGNVTVGAFQPSIAENCRVNYSLTSTIPSPNAANTVAQYASSLPSSSTALFNYPNARRWAAKDGVYCVGKIGDFSRQGPVVGVPTEAPILGGDISSGGSQGLSNYTWAGQGTGPFNGVGCTMAMFEGLNPTYGNFQLSIRIIYEYFPNSLFGNAYQPLSSPTAPYDFMALQEYTMAIQRLPPAVPVGMNASGDWFRMVSKTLGSVAKLASPYLGLLNPALGSGARMLGRYLVDQPNTRTFVPGTKNGLKMKKVASKTPRALTRIKNAK